MQQLYPRANLTAWRRLLTVVGCAVLLATAAATGTGLAYSATAQPTGNYDVSISYPANFSVGENQTIGIEVDNTGNSDDVFNPVVEVPLPDSINASTGATETAYVSYADGSTESRQAEVANSTYRSGTAFFVYGENVPAGETRTYYLNLSVATSGQKTLDAEVRPLYNEEVSVRTEKSSYAAGYGQLNVTVEDPTGATVSDASVIVDGSMLGTGSASASVLEGQHTVNVAGVDSVPLPTLSGEVGVGETQQLTYIAHETATDSVVVAHSRPAQVIDGSQGRVTTQPTATQPHVQNVSFIVDMAGGQATVALADPASIGPVSQRSTTTDATAMSTNTTNETTLMTIQNGGDAEVALTVTGYRLGDALKDGSVTAADAQEVAQITVANADSHQYSDVNGDGQITAVDAMLIAQYNDGNRDATYDRGGA